MNRVVTPGLAMLAGIAIGALAVQGLRAQAKPPVYYVAEISVTNADDYAKQFAPQAQALIKAHGGRFLALGGNSARDVKIVTMEGEPPMRAAIMVWDSIEQIQAWRADPQFKELRAIVDEYAIFRAYAIEGLPQ